MGGGLHKTCPFSLTCSHVLELSESAHEKGIVVKIKGRASKCSTINSHLIRMKKHYTSFANIWSLPHACMQKSVWKYIVHVYTYLALISFAFWTAILIRELLRMEVQRSTRLHLLDKNQDHFRHFLLHFKVIQSIKLIDTNLSANLVVPTDSTGKYVLQLVLKLYIIAPLLIMTAVFCLILIFVSALFSCSFYGCLLYIH